MLHNELQIKQSLIARWRLGGVETLVKVMGCQTKPDPTRAIGYVTSIKYLAGRTPIQLEQAVGLREKTKLLGGAAIYAVSPLPRHAQFEFRSYSNTPEGVSTTVKAAHKDYPPGLGVPQWEITGLTQANLVLLETLKPGQSFRFEASRLGPWT